MDQDLDQRIQSIEMRNQRVELDKAWQTSFTRVLTVVLMTYGLTSLVFWLIGSSRFLLDPLVPTAGFLFSIQSLPFIKKIWIKRNSR